MTYFCTYHRSLLWYQLAYVIKMKFIQLIIIIVQVVKVNELQVYINYNSITVQNNTFIETFISSSNNKSMDSC